MNTISINDINEIVILNKETELKVKNYCQVNENQKLKPFEYSKGIGSTSEDKFGEKKNFRITWHK